MGGFFGATSKRDCVEDIFFGTDYHCHLGTYRAGIVMHDDELGYQREIHNIQNDTFKSKFTKVLSNMKGSAGLGCISDMAPSPLIIASHLGIYAICMVGAINNIKELADELLKTKGFHFDALSQGKINPTEILASLINVKDDFKEGILYAQDKIEGSCNLMILTADGTIIAARDKYGRLPVIIGKDEDGHAITFESFAFEKLGYEFEKELGPNEIVEITADEIKVLSPAGDDLRICSFLWNYYGYPTSSYEGVNVEVMRNRNGEILAENEINKDLFDKIDFVCGVPDSGTPHAMGFSNYSKVKFARCFIKYTPSWSRSFMPHQQSHRNKVAKMKQIPVKDLIKGRNLLFVDDSIVRGTQFKETVDFLKENGANEVHMRSACPPMMYPCKYLNFSPSTGDMDLITRRIIVKLEGEEGLNYISEYSDKNTERGKRLRKEMAEKFNFASLDFQSLEGIIKAIGLEPCKLCTYCWSGKE